MPVNFSISLLIIRSSGEPRPKNFSKEAVFGIKKKFVLLKVDLFLGQISIKSIPLFLNFFL
jgi:hypothetical protein